jgi:hypothetical protein
MIAENYLKRRKFILTAQRIYSDLMKALWGLMRRKTKKPLLTERLCNILMKFY